MGLALFWCRAMLWTALEMPLTSTVSLLSLVFCVWHLGFICMVEPFCNQIWMLLKTACLGINGGNNFACSRSACIALHNWIFHLEMLWVHQAHWLVLKGILFVNKPKSSFSLITLGNITSSNASWVQCWLCVPQRETSQTNESNRFFGWAQTKTISLSYLKDDFN